MIDAPVSRVRLRVSGAPQSSQLAPDTDDLVASII